MFKCPHKITVDEDAKKIVICDRENHRRVWLDYDLNVSNLGRGLLVHASRAARHIPPHHVRVAPSPILVWAHINW